MKIFLILILSCTPLFAGVAVNSLSEAIIDGGVTQTLADAKANYPDKKELLEAAVAAKINALKNNPVKGDEVVARNILENAKSAGLTVDSDTTQAVLELEAAAPVQINTK